MDEKTEDYLCYIYVKGSENLRHEQIGDIFSLAEQRHWYFELEKMSHCFIIAQKGNRHYWLKTWIKCCVEKMTKYEKEFQFWKSGSNDSSCNN